MVNCSSVGFASEKVVGRDLEIPPTGWLSVEGGASGVPITATAAPNRMLNDRN